MMSSKSIVLFTVIAVKYVFCKSCYYDYSDRKIPGAMIAEYERRVGYYTNSGCPLLKEDSEFLLDEIPNDFREFVYHKELLDGACISHEYQIGEVPLSGGMTGNNKTIEDIVQARGGAIIRTNAEVSSQMGFSSDIFFLPYSTVYTTIINKKVREISDAKRTVTLDLSLTLMWMDYNIYTYKSSLREFLQRNTKDEITPENAKLVWKPDLPIYNLFDYKAFSSSLRMVGLRISRETHFDGGLCLVGPMLQYDIETKVTIYCNLDFSGYPLDESNCKMLFGGQSSNLRFQLYDPENENHRNQSFQLSDLKVAVSVMDEPGSSPTEQKIGLKINIQRHLKPYILKYYLPCIIITLVSQCSFLIPLDALPGRVALVVTQLLTLTSLFIHEMDKSPPSGRIDKLSVFLLVSLIFIVATMMEFVIVLLTKRRFENKVSPIRNETGNRTNIRIGSKNTVVSKSDVKLEVEEHEDNDTLDNPQKKYLKKQLKRALFNSIFEPNDKPHDCNSKRLVNTAATYKSRIDIISAIIFPTAYALFNLIYWYCVM